MTGLPGGVPAGALLHLQPGEWYVRGHLASEETTIRVVAVDRAYPRTRDGEQEVWVSAHWSTCTDPDRTGHLPCFGNYVRVTAIVREASAG
ncbi:hypothetical protein [Micromonospora sp. NBC_01796]|uniref:hypothetical protein n=1 Tax=Micromonospora sp. NBC_01796 TaxID=2975987 RepID=UPI002DDC3E32|nr:hypothetical protein [Micromonospora sp. NBC_01796]WSA87327.1 hypothetical protein OIE47_06855 [Micromonospora sp. NBC_01796]